MKQFASIITGLALFISSTPALAATFRANVLTPDGFCTVHQDGTKGVRFDKASYTAWLAQFAITTDRLKLFIEQETLRAAREGKPLTELQIGQLEAKVKKAAADHQRNRINQGQAILCR